ncbi:hypothetical protein DUNSADRAFT_10056 [Dunaliella salina]|nr:hypothetical protein DUNSADRAFT_10056 [Dunaliella salina]KAF5833566.1 hypothetical protein DUNSADRAFT_10056 [Dunaliella salina]|eukprot:KAF5833565.1 hypothetical protein DUNSADRAFT_10056 [Dunaliella salina]
MSRVAKLANWVLTVSAIPLGKAAWRLMLGSPPGRDWCTGRFGERGTDPGTEFVWLTAPLSPAGASSFHCSNSWSGQARGERGSVCTTCCELPAVDATPADVGGWSSTLPQLGLVC